MLTIRLWDLATDKAINELNINKDNEEEVFEDYLLFCSENGLVADDCDYDIV